MTTETFHIAPGRLYQHRTLSFRQALVTGRPDEVTECFHLAQRIEGLR